MQSQALKSGHSAESGESLKYWWNKFVAVVALINLVFVLFNISYIPLRDIYFRQFPPIVTLYDPVKSIEPHPDTQQYLETVDVLATQLSQEGFPTPQTEQLLGSLRQQSTEIIEENPFIVANKFGTFAQLKRRMQYHLDTTSAKQAFALFWSRDYLEQVGWQNALSFFDSSIRPLFAKNYYRSIDENGQFIDEFWRIDIYFIIFFAVELLWRTFWTSRGLVGLTWGDIILRRWYDWLLLLPTWRWLRIIPVSVRLHQSRVVNMERILSQVTYEPAAYLADRVSTFLMVRLINQTQESIEQGETARALLEGGDYVQVSEVNKVDTIIDRLLEVSIYKVLPQVQPNLQELLHYSMKEALKDSQLYKGLEKVPGMEALPAEAIEQLSDYLATAVYEVLANSYSDVKGRVLFERLTHQFRHSLRRQLRQEATKRELQSLLFDLLEELKINYVQRSTKDDPEATLEEAEQLRQTAEQEQ